MNRRQTSFVLAGLMVFSLSAAELAHASNGMNMIGYGARSIAMGGADLATTGSPAAMNINPAGISRISDPEFDFGLGLMEPSLSHSDRFGNDEDDVLDRYPMPFLGYVHPVRNLTFGVGLFVQGGMGAEYASLVTPFSALLGSGQVPPELFGLSEIPPTDSTRTNLMHAKLTPTVAWRVTPAFSLGASLNVSYARVEMEFFPNTSVLADLDGSGVPGDTPGEAFLGMEMQDLSDIAVGLRLGFQYTRGALALGGAYFTKTDLDFDGGTATMNLAALGLGRVDYDCKISDFAWPQQAGLGLAYEVSPTLLIAGDVDWVEWSDAIDTLTITADNPDLPLAPPSREIPFRMNWEDQWVWALGMELRPVERWAVRLGYNHGDTPIPDASLRPHFPAIAEDHVTAGAGFAKGSWIFDVGLEYALESEKTNDSLDPAVNPFAPGSQETLSQFIAHFTVRTVFSRGAQPQRP